MRKGLFITFGAILLFIIGSWQLSKSREFQLFGELVHKVNATDKVVALTFDDGPWSEDYTTQVIGVLNDLDVKGTFFLNGLGIEKNFEPAKQLVLAGHQIGNHSYSHQRMIFMGLDEVGFEVDKTTELIRKIGY
jgi:peptidoglycan/xylan/chitin deacetylase (PgdA/CDA1 family)